MEVEVILRSIRAQEERLKAAVVIIELDPDCVEEDLPVEHVIVGSIGIRALRCYGQKPIFPSFGRVCVHEAPELIRKWY